MSRFRFYVNLVDFSNGKKRLIITHADDKRYDNRKKDEKGVRGGRRRKRGNEARKMLRKVAAESAVAAAAIVPKLLSASLDGARCCTRFESKWPHRDNASRKWGRVIKPLYNRSVAAHAAAR